jgi:hypothetical protein
LLSIEIAKAWAAPHAIEIIGWVKRGNYIAVGRDITI